MTSNEVIEITDDDLEVIELLSDGEVEVDSKENVVTQQQVATSETCSSLVNLDTSYNLSLQSSSFIQVQSKQHSQISTQRLTTNSDRIKGNLSSAPKAKDRFDELMSLLSDDDDNEDATVVQREQFTKMMPAQASRNINDFNFPNFRSSSSSDPLLKSYISSKDKTKIAIADNSLSLLDTSIEDYITSKKTRIQLDDTSFVQQGESHQINLLTSSPRKDKTVSFNDDDDDFLRRPDTGKNISLVRSSTDIDGFNLQRIPNPVSLLNINNTHGDTDFEDTADDIVLPSDSESDIEPIRRKDNSLIHSESSGIEIIPVFKPSLKRKREISNSSLLDSFEEYDAINKQRGRNEVSYKNGFKGSLLAELNLENDSIARRSLSDPGFNKPSNFRMTDLSTLAQSNKSTNCNKLSETLDKTIASRPAQRIQTLTNALTFSSNLQTKANEKTKQSAVRMTKEQREELKQVQAQRKLTYKLFKTANKSKREKEELLNEMILNISPELLEQFKTVENYEEIFKDIQINSNHQPNERLITFSRKVTSFYNASVDLFYPSEPSIVPEKFATLVYKAEDFLSLVENNTALPTFQKFQTDNANRINNLIIIIIGYDSLLSKIRSQQNRAHTALVRQQLEPTSELPPTTTTNSRSRKKKTPQLSAITPEDIEDAVAVLEVNSFKTFTTKNIYDTLIRLRSFAYTISSARYDKNERNPDFATIGTLKSGKDMDQAYFLMLQTLPMMTEPRAKRTMEKIPTFRRLYEVVQQEKSLIGNDGKSLFPGSIEDMVRRLFSSEDEEQLLRNQI